MSAQLTSKQLAVLEALLSGSNVSAAAKAAGVHRSTIHEWLHQPPFQAALEDARRTRTLAVKDALHAMADTALAAVRAVLTDPKAAAPTRVRAALAVLKSATTPEPVTRFLPHRMTNDEFDRYCEAVYLAAHQEAVAGARRVAAGS